MGLFKKEKFVMPCNYCNEVIENRPRVRYPLHAPEKAVVFCQYLNRTMNLDNSFSEICPPIVRAREGKKIVKYCKWCGEDVEKGHSKACPFIHGTKARYPWGIDVTNDPAMGLHLVRFGVLVRFGMLAALGMNKEERIRYESKDKKVAARLAFEFLRFGIRRLSFAGKFDEKRKEEAKKIAEGYRSKGWLTPEQEKYLLAGEFPEIDFLR